MGLPDGVFNTLVEANCRACHQDQNIVNPGSIPDRHHLLVGATIPDPTASPDPIYGAPGGTYECLSCHQLVWNDTAFSYDFVSFRDCLLCHDQVAGEASVHHLTAAAMADDCKACHGPIDNPNDGHYVPTYDASLVTPQLKLGTGANGEGGCAFCHAAGTDTSTGQPITVYTNAKTHHSTGLVYLNKCYLCHDMTLPSESKLKIRQCENCHGVKSLHNIQVDSDANGIDPGAEDSYFGHIGNQDDCWGCHGFTAAAVPLSGPVVPDVNGLSAYTVTTGVDTAITVTGIAFTNSVQTPNGAVVLTSVVVLTGANGIETTLIPSAITESSMDVTIPTTMAQGNYALSAVKVNTVSNSVNLSIMPDVKITYASCLNGIVSITGSGFSQYVNATGSGTSVSLPDAMADCTVLT
ncbi:MAG: hypothetical protein E4H46_01310 [Desulfobacterales bacterium]|nr:MAG: hypothetical protein E4H46_01310 [Desulfobacterales bacterium]